MRLLSFIADGEECFGAVSGDGVVMLNDKIGQPDLRLALASGTMEAMRRTAQTPSPITSSTTSNSCAHSAPDKILCAGVNYRAHAAEVGRELPKQPAYSSASPTRWLATAAR